MAEGVARAHPGPPSAHTWKNSLGAPHAVLTRMLKCGWYCGRYGAGEGEHVRHERREGRWVQGVALQEHPAGRLPLAGALRRSHMTLPLLS